MKYGRTLKIFVMGREPRSLKSVELVNWTGQAFIGQREHLAQARQRDELSEPAIYMLLGDGVESSSTIDIYVGETENFADRIFNHAQTKDWWTKFVAFVSKDKNLTKAHVKYLEAELYKLACRSIGTLIVKNSNIPSSASLPEADIASMNEFLENIIFVLESLGLSYFPTQSTSERTVTSRESILIVADSMGGASSSREPSLNTTDGMEFQITLSRDLGNSEDEVLKSYMVVRNGAYVLKAGSLIRKIPTDGFLNGSYYGLWKQITESDAVMAVDNANLLKTTRDIEFSAPSGAGAVVRARATNGRIEWKRISDGKPLNECETQIPLVIAASER